MKYTKPEAVLSGLVLTTIQGLTGPKGIHTYIEWAAPPPEPMNAFTPNAYEADE